MKSHRLFLFPASRTTTTTSQSKSRRFFLSYQCEYETHNCCLDNWFSCRNRWLKSFKGHLRWQQTSFFTLLLVSFRNFESIVNNSDWRAFKLLSVDLWSSNFLIRRGRRQTQSLAAEQYSERKQMLFIRNWGKSITQSSRERASPFVQTFLHWLLSVLIEKKKK